MLRTMNLHTGRLLAATALLVGTLLLSGCAGGRAQPQATPKQAEETSTTSTVDAVIAAIDPALIDHVDRVMNASVDCLGADGTPQASMRAWQNMRYVWLVKGTEPLDVVDALVKTNEKDGWTTASTDLQITAGANPAVPSVLYLSSTSTCFNSAT